MKMIRVFLLGLVVAFGAVAEQKLPNILWITSEDNGPQLGCYGDKYSKSPNLDALAAKGMIYLNCWSTAPVCAPARTTLISGLYPQARVPSICAATPAGRRGSRCTPLTCGRSGITAQTILRKTTISARKVRCGTRAAARRIGKTAPAISRLRSSIIPLATKARSETRLIRSLPFMIPKTFACRRIIRTHPRCVRIGRSTTIASP